jgi:hypothetical protein
MKRNFLSIFCFLSVAIFFNSCNDRNPDPIPSWYSVSIVFNVNSFDNDFSVGSVKTFNNQRGYAGVSGVVVYRVSLDEFHAYDMACPNDWRYGGMVISHSTSATAPPDGLLFECGYCKVKFSILDGTPQSSGYKYSMKKYQVTPTGRQSGEFQVHN